MLPTFVSYATKFSRAGSMIECFSGTWRAWIGRGITAELGAAGKIVATRHIFKDLPLLQPFVPYGTKGCHAAKMKLPRESCHISKTDVSQGNAFGRPGTKFAIAGFPRLIFKIRRLVALTCRVVRLPLSQCSSATSRWTGCHVGTQRCRTNALLFRSLPQIRVEREDGGGEAKRRQ
jgi:hypothetical protein